MNVWTYYNADEAREGDGEMMRLWCLSWQRRGWTPRILTPRSAQTHIRHKEAIENHPDALRWLAFEQSGGGWYSDFDCINYSFAPTDVNPTFGVLAPGFQAWPAMLWASQNGALRLSEMALGGPLDFAPLPLTVADEVGAEGWEQSPVVHFSRQAIFRHFGTEIPPWKVATQCDRKF